MVRRIAFITEGFMGSTLPLIRQLCLRGYEVDLYYYKRVIHEPEACELDYRAERYGINVVPREVYGGISRYVGNDNLRIYVFSQVRPLDSVPVVRSVMGLIMRCQAYGAARVINGRCYDAINVICNYDMGHMADLLRYLSGNVVVSLHEVWNHGMPCVKPSRLLAEVIRKGCRIVLFSDHSKGDIGRIAGVDMDLVRVNPFGLFESFASLPELEVREGLPERYFLFFGYIRRYKGLGVLHEAVRLMGEALDGYKIVVGGQGDDGVLEEMRGDDRYVLIQRFIRNGELVGLIKRAYAVVCPYLSMSQSGIPQTAFPFGTPIVASNLEGFREIITPDVGMLFPTGDARSLARCLSELIVHPDRREQMRRNILSFTQRHPRYDWENICENYLEIIGL